MANKMMEYSRGRMDGMALAERIVKDGGLEALTKDIQTRGRMQMNIGLSMKELDVASEHIKQVTIETLRIACVSILHDTFGFGQTRCQRFIDAFDKISSYLSNGWTTWMDLIESIKTDLSLVMEDKWLNDLEMTGKYAHPDPEDIYTEADLIDETLWKAMLKDLHFTEEPITKTLYQIRDDHGDPILQYEGQYNKIQMYDVMSGIQIARDLLGWK